MSYGPDGIPHPATTAGYTIPDDPYLLMSHVTLCCPSCRSTEVYPVAGGYIGQVYRCKACGYRGSFVLELEDTEEPASPPEK